jgi:hypothetical protein
MPRTERQEELVSIGEIVATAVIRKGKNRFDTLFFSGMAVVILASALVGFAPDLLSGRSVQGSSTAELARTHPWCGLFLVDPLLIVQIGLVGKRRVDMHRRLGMLGFALACLVVVFGVLVATENLVRNYADMNGSVGFKAFYAEEPIPIRARYFTLRAAGSRDRRRERVALEST